MEKTDLKTQLAEVAQRIRTMREITGLSEEEMENVIRLAQQVEIPVRLVTPVDFLDWYVESLKAVVRERLEDDAPKPLLGLHVVVDAGNGAGGFYADFLEDLDADSLDIMEFIMILEEEFDFEDLDQMDLSPYRTVGDVVEFLERSGRS